MGESLIYNGDIAYVVLQINQIKLFLGFFFHFRFY